jgi:hypothetical protein
MVQRSSVPLLYWPPGQRRLPWKYGVATDWFASTAEGQTEPYVGWGALRGKLSACALQRPTNAYDR